MQGYGSATLQGQDYSPAGPEELQEARAAVSPAERRHQPQGQGPPWLNPSSGETLRLMPSSWSSEEQCVQMMSYINDSELYLMLARSNGVGNDS